MNDSLDDMVHDSLHDLPPTDQEMDAPVPPDSQPVFEDDTRDDIVEELEEMISGEECGEVKSSAPTDPNAVDTLPFDPKAAAVYEVGTPHGFQALTLTDVERRIAELQSLD